MYPTDYRLNLLGWREAKYQQELRSSILALEIKNWRQRDIAPCVIFAAPLPYSCL
jgi:hypothetical protein